LSIILPFRLTSRNGKPVNCAALLRVAAATEQRPKWAQTDLLMNFYQKFTAELVVDIAVALLVQSVVNQVLDYVELVWFLEPSERLKLRVTVNPWARSMGNSPAGSSPTGLPSANTV
jgi:hypothetical protein